MICKNKKIKYLPFSLFIIYILIWIVLPAFRFELVTNNASNNINANTYFYTENEEVYSKILSK